MAYGYFPATYQPYYGYQNAAYNAYQQSQAMMQQTEHRNQQAAPTIQQSGFVSVPSMDDVRAWPVAPGNSITFYVETVPPILATKTKGFSQLEPPVIKEFDLVEKEATPSKAPESPQTSETNHNFNTAEYVLKSDFERIRADVDSLKEVVNKLKPEDSELGVLRDE